MALRLIEMVLQEKNSEKVQELLKEHKVIENRQIRLSDGEILIRLLLEADKSEAILDLLEQQCAGMEEARVVILPVEATLPRNKPEQTDSPGQQPEEKKAGSVEKSYMRISRMLPNVLGSI